MQGVHPLILYRQEQSPPLSQAGLARLLGVSRASVNRWESGERKPDKNILPKIKEKTGLEPKVVRPDLAEAMEVG